MATTSAVQNDTPHVHTGWTPTERRTGVAPWLAATWVVILTWWTATNHARLRIAEALIARHEERGSAPLTDSDHLSDFPELHATFEALDLTTQTDLYWVFALGMFAATGLVIAIGMALTTRRRLPIAIMAGTWVGAVLLAFVNADTLSLLGWLNN